MSEMDDALAELKTDIDAIEDAAERKETASQVMTSIAGSDDIQQLVAVVKALNEMAVKKDPRLVEAAQGLANGVAETMEAEGHADYAAYKASELAKLKTLEDFGAAYGVDVAANKPFTAYKDATNKLLNIVENLSTIPDDKYDDAEALGAAVKAAFPEKKGGNPLRRPGAGAPSM